MIGIWNSYVELFLIVVGVVTLLSFGLPLTLVPVRWARLFRWEIPQSQALVSFLGRSLGVLISIISIMAFLVIRTPAAMPFFFDMLLFIFGGMILLHVYGAIRRVQPFTETIEILLWVLLGFITLGFYPI